MKDMEKYKEIIEQGIKELFPKSHDANEELKEDFKCRIEFDFLMSIKEDEDE